MTFAWIGGIPIEGGREYIHESGLFVTNDGVDGWFDLPGVKSAREDRAGADGNFGISDRDVVYSARTVTFNLAAVVRDRAEAVAVQSQFNALSHRVVEVRVDDVDDTFVTGTIQTAFGPRWVDDVGEFVVTVDTDDPRRYATVAQVVTLTGAASTGGVRYPVQYPIRYYGDSAGASPSGTVENVGTARSWPVITVYGDMQGGFTLIDSLGRAITYTDDVYLSSPVTIDCGRRVATVLGANRSTALSRREWFDVDDGQSLTVTFTPAQVAGTTWAELSFRSAWI